MDFAQKVHATRLEENNLKGDGSDFNGYYDLCKHFWDINHPDAPGLKAKHPGFNILRTSVRAGMRSKRNFSSNQLPASSIKSCCRVRFPTGPVPSVVLSSVPSCSTTSSPSLLVRTSTSIAVAPTAIA